MSNINTEKLSSVLKTFVNDVNKMINNKENNENNQCSICFCDIEKNNFVKLNCGHLLDLDCYNELIFSSNVNGECNNKCPLCRDEIKLPDKVNNKMYDILKIINGSNHRVEDNILFADNDNEEDDDNDYEDDDEEENENSNINQINSFLSNFILTSILSRNMRNSSNIISYRRNSTAWRLRQGIINNRDIVNYTYNELRNISNDIQNTNINTFNRALDRLVEDRILNYNLVNNIYSVI